MTKVIKIDKDYTVLMPYPVEKLFNVFHMA